MQQQQKLNLSRDQILARIAPRLLSTEHHADRIATLVKKPLAADVVMAWYADVSDLVSSRDQDTVASLPITYDLARNLEISLDDLECVSRQNTKNAYSIRPMRNVLEAFCEASVPFPEVEDTAIPMLVLTNRASFYGAAAIMDPEIRQELGKFGSVYLLPSSVHELLAVPVSAAAPEDLVTMVRQINSDDSIVRPEDVLSDHVFTLTSDGRFIVAA